MQLADEHTGSFPARTVVCPRCAGPSLYVAQNPYRPFCSARCQGIDLGAWSSETFALPASPESADYDTPGN
jgi:endogenous inhibitor of DNA gyrase (YacG/DUF329 family)